MSNDNENVVPAGGLIDEPAVAPPTVAPVTPPVTEDHFFEAEDTPQETVVEETEAAPVPVVPTESKQKVEFQQSPYAPHTDVTKKMSNPVTMIFPSDTREQLRETINEASNKDFSASPEGRNWASTLLDSLSICPADDVAQNALERPGTFWRQSVPQAGGELKGGYSLYRDKSGGAGTIASGDTAIMRMQQHLRLGSSYRIPLWNTGIWVTFRAPDEPALMELERSLTSDKIELGRQSYGLTYSNTTAVFTDRVVNFAMEQIWNTSVKVPNGFDYRTIISSHDIPALLLGLAAAIWPDGFNHSRVCIANPDKCTHTIEELIHIPKTLMVDTASLTAWQTTHMSKTSNAVMSLEDVARYKQEMVIAQNKQVVLCKGTHKEVTMSMRVPNVTEFITAGNTWINTMVNMVDTALGKEVSNENRNQYILAHGKATNLRQYSHWISTMKYGDTVTPEGDEETLTGLISTMSGDDDLRKQFMSEVAKFIAESTATVVGVPSFDCPACGGVNRSTRGHPTIKEVIPYDALQVFFALIAQRVQRISER